MKIFTNFRSQRIHLSTCSNFTRGQTHRYILWLNKPPRRHRMIVWSHWKKTLSSSSAAATFLSRNVKAAVAGRSRCKFLRRNTSRLRRYQWERERLWRFLRRWAHRSRVVRGKEWGRCDGDAFDLLKHFTFLLVHFATSLLSALNSPCN